MKVSVEFKEQKLHTNEIRKECFLFSVFLIISIFIGLTYSSNKLFGIFLAFFLILGVYYLTSFVIRVIKILRRIK